jgi:chromosome segregation ATPase
MNTDELLGKIAEFLNPIAKDISHMKTDISQIKTELLHLKTAGDALKAGQDVIREELAKKADKADVHRLEQKVDKSNKYLQDHEERLEALEEEQLGTHKN